MENLMKKTNEGGSGSESRSSSSYNICTPQTIKKAPELKWILASEGADDGNIQTPQIKNHTATLYNKKLYVFGGYDGKKNHSQLRIFDTETLKWIKAKRAGGNPPPGRNGHTATLVDHKLYILGGWLGQGPLAADDMHILDLINFKWLDFNVKGLPPGPCNMHTADSYNNKIYVFRGGDGKDYLNDLHELDTINLQWTKVTQNGACPPPRANHSSAVVKQHLYIFGGWDGSKRLNDLYMLNLDSMTWIQVIVEGESPAPRAGMSLCNVDNKLYLFGGSGPHAYCFNDLYSFDPEQSRWTQCDNFSNPDKQPKARAGHSKTLVDSRLFIIGGSYGQDYLKDVYILDTDPCPQFSFQNTSKSKLLKGIREYTNKEEFSDIVFIVEGRKFYAHKLILSLLSEKFRVMFTNGMMESKQKEIEIQNISYPVFSSIMHYLYTGDFHFGADTEGQELSLDYMFEFLRVSDEYILEDVKMNCEEYLINILNTENYSLINDMADMYNAERLKEYCNWYYRRHSTQFAADSCMSNVDNIDYDD